MIKAALAICQHLSRWAPQCCVYISFLVVHYPFFLGGTEPNFDLWFMLSYWQVCLPAWLGWHLITGISSDSSETFCTFRLGLGGRAAYHWQIDCLEASKRRGLIISTRSINWTTAVLWSRMKWGICLWECNCKGSPKPWSAWSDVALSDLQTGDCCLHDYRRAAPCASEVRISYVAQHAFHHVVSSSDSLKLC